MPIQFYQKIYLLAFTFGLVALIPVHFASNQISDHLAAYHENSMFQPLVATVMLFIIGIALRMRRTASI